MFRGGADQVLELRVLEDLPPGKVRVGSYLSLSLRAFSQIAERSRRLHDGPMVVRPNHAAADHIRCQNNRNQWPKLLHQAPLCVLLIHELAAHLSLPSPA